LGDKKFHVGVTHFPNEAGTNENESCVYKGRDGGVFLTFEMADEQALLRKPIELKATGLPDVIPESQFASTVLKTVENDFMGMIMTQAIRSCTNDILKKEVTTIADEMPKFRKEIGRRMKEDESLDDGYPVQLENLRRSFEAGWRMWRTAWSNREDEAYDTFISVMTGESEKTEEEKNED